MITHSGTYFPYGILVLIAFAIGSRALSPSDTADRAIAYLDCSRVGLIEPTAEAQSFEALSQEPFPAPICR